MKKYYLPFVLMIMAISVFFFSCHTSKKITSKPAQVREKPLPPNNALITGIVTKLSADTSYISLKVSVINRRGSGFHAPVHPRSVIKISLPRKISAFDVGQKYKLEINAAEVFGGNIQYTLVRTINRN